MGKNYGGPAYIGNSRVLFVRDGYMMTKIFFDELYSETIDQHQNSSINLRRLGDAKNNTLVLSAARGYGDHTNLLGFSIIGDPSLCIWNGAEAINRVEVESIIRNSNGITINLKDFDPNAGTAVIFDQINGPTVKKNFSDKSITVKDIDKNSIIYIYSKNSLSYTDNISISDNVLMNGHKYYYTKKATLGSIKSQKNLVLKTNSKITIDASEDVHLNGIFLDTLSTLTVKTAGKCYINNVQGPAFGIKTTLIVHADTVIINKYPTDATLIFSKYDKYRRPEEMKKVVVIDNTMRKAPLLANDYKPLLEEGKEWHLTSACWFPQDNPTQSIEILKLEGTKIIDDEEYHILNLYHGTDPDNLTFLWPMAYLKEDTEARKVWVKMHYLSDSDEYSCPLYPLNQIIGDFGNDLIYDFTYTENTYLAGVNENEAPDALKYTYGEETELVCNDGIHHGVTILERGDVSPYSIIEGIGLIGKGRQGSCYLLYYGDSFVSSHFEYQWPYLYEVVSGDGEIIYRDDDRAPGFAGAISAKTDSNAAVRVFNLQGMPLKENDGTSSPTDGLAPGIYIIQRDGSTSKAVVR